MPSIKAEIVWDKPEDENWIGIYNLKLALESYCPNTKFKVININTGIFTEENLK